VPCNVLAAAALVLLFIYSHGNLTAALGLLVLPAIVLNETALANWCVGGSHRAIMANTLALGKCASRQTGACKCGLGVVESTA